MKRIMVDIETLGTQPGAAILSVGWCEFDLVGVLEGSEQEIRIPVIDSFKRNLGVEAETIEWWLEQPGKPWRDDSPILPLEEAMNRVRACFAGAAQVWAKPPGFDLAAIVNAMRVCGMTPTWTFREECCFRTLKRLSPPALALPEIEGTKHGALDDAIQQAREAAVILNYLSTGDFSRKGNQ